MAAAERVFQTNMASLANAMLLSVRSVKSIFNISSIFSAKSLCQTSSALHTSPRRYGLEEFFDAEANFVKQEVRVGRSWEKDDLRIKSNSDLHKLWYVLLKERNMLRTMEQAYLGTKESMPSPERIEKVEESMKNLEDVVRERNRAYFELETGIHGERPNRLVVNDFGLQENRHLEEFTEPIEREETKTERYFPRDSYVHIFRRRLQEKNMYLETRARRADGRYVMKLMRTFPDIDLDYLQELFPHLKVKKLIKNSRTVGHFDRQEATWSKPGMF